MSLYKTGALIVIEQSVKLGEYIKPSNEIEAKLTSRMLQSLFFNKAPYHDGAVIIRNMQIFAAGCVLPLTTDENIDGSLGTRHRAAVGITEVSDAVAVVVSEETGIISVAHEGRLKRKYNYNSLRQELFRLLTRNTYTIKRKSNLEKVHEVADEEGE